MPAGLVAFIGAEMNKMLIAAFAVPALVSIAVAQTAESAPNQTKNTPGLPLALSSAELGGMSGGTSPSGVAISNQVLSATNSGNTVTADSVTSGAVSLQSGTFSGFNGVGNFVFNTGNNNNLQGSLSITIVTSSVN